MAVWWVSGKERKRTRQWAPSVSRVLTSYLYNSKPTTGSTYDDVLGVLARGITTRYTGERGMTCRVTGGRGFAGSALISLPFPHWNTKMVASDMSQSANSIRDYGTCPRVNPPERWHIRHSLAWTGERRLGVGGE